MLTDFPWRRFNRFIDVGGSSGSFLAALLERHPNSSGVIFDLPQVALVLACSKLSLHCEGCISAEGMTKCEERSRLIAGRQACGRCVAAEADSFVTKGTVCGRQLSRTRCSTFVSAASLHGAITCM